jgi:hypothetical protein
MAEMQDFEAPELGELETVETEIKQQETIAEEPKSEEPEVPEKYRGKSVADIVKMHQEAEKVISRQGLEVGEVRKLADELLRSQLQPKKEVEQPKEVDFFENPQEAIRRAVETNPEVMAAKQYAVQARQEQARQALAAKHPDFGQLLQDSEFAQWVQASKVRTALLKQADAYDVDAADELFSTFKQLRQVKQNQVQQVEKTERNKAMQAAAVDTGGSGESGRKVYRRADLIRLKMTDPARYDSMNDEILAAYAEGRVK